MNIAVAFFIFNRPELTAQVFAEIRRARPSKLLVVGDGPRFEGERKRVEAARAVVEKGVDWHCHLFRNYSDTNLGCRLRVCSGLDWVFSQCEEAIILEDDCLPHPSFFQFCAELLEKYRNEPKIMMISGQSFWGRKEHPPDKSYYFARETLIWGWGSWRRAWRRFDSELKEWPQLSTTHWLSERLLDQREVNDWKSRFNSVYKNDIDTWDYQWKYSLLINDGLAVIPFTNLVSNLGFGDHATHTVSSDHAFAALQTVSMIFPLKHPLSIEWDKEADRQMVCEMRKLLRPKRSLIKYVKAHFRNRIKRIVLLILDLFFS